MRETSLALFLGLTLTTACGGSAASPASPATPASLLELGEITIFDATTPIFKLHPDGTTERAAHKGQLAIKPGETASSDSLPMVWEAGPTLHADGLIDGKGKRGVARFDASGTITATETNESLPMTITGSRLTIKLPTGKPVVLELTPTGTVNISEMPRPEDIHLHVDGATSPGKMKSALLLLAFALAPGKKVETIAPVDASMHTTPVPEIMP